MVTTRELARAWWGNAAGPVEEQVVESLLSMPQPYFVVLPSVPGMYRVRAGTGQPGQSPVVRADQVAIQASIQRHLGDAPDLYHRGVDPQTGTITLKFHFPAVARERYAAELERIGVETGVDVRVDPNPHQGMLAEAALALLPRGMRATKAPALHHTEQVVRVQCDGDAVDSVALETVAHRMQETTGWRLDLVLPGQKAVASTLAAWEPQGVGVRLDATAARNLAVGRFDEESGCYKVGIDQAKHTLILRFYFPDSARAYYDEEFGYLADDTGWRITLHPEPHQAALQAEARAVLPPTLDVIGTPALHHQQRSVLARYRGEATEGELHAAQQDFAQVTGWQLTLQRMNER